MDSLLIYGAYGYTGELIAREAVARGESPILAGRNPQPLHDLGADLDCRSRAFDLDGNGGDIAEHLAGVDVVLNCAGPFERTADPLVSACLSRGIDYLDITGELTVFERLARRDTEATEADVTLLPGVGFDVVPTDCLAAHLHSRLPEATQLSIAIDAEGTLSGGTLKTLIGGLGSGGAVRENGTLRYVPTAGRTRVVDFGSERKTVVTAPLGDVSTAYRTTGIPTISAYVAIPPAARFLLSVGRPLGSLLDSSATKRLLTALVDRTVSGPSAEQRAENKTTIWGEAWSEETGEAVQSLLRTPDPYEVTVEAALVCAERVLAGDAPTGYTTPAGAFGSELALELPGVSRQDV